MFDRVLNTTLEDMKYILAAFTGQWYQSTNLLLKAIDLYDVDKDIQCNAMELNATGKKFPYTDHLDKT